MKKNYFGGHFDLFGSNLGKDKFSWKEGLCQFLNIPIIYRRAKNQKKLIWHSWGKRWTDWLKDGQTTDFAWLSAGQSSKY